MMKNTTHSECMRPTRVEVTLDVLADNYRLISDFVGRAKVMPVLKADAYGHGLIPCAKRLEQVGADIFGVAFLEEALQLRSAGIGKPILALGGVSGSQVATFIENDIDITASSIMKLEAIDSMAAELGKKARVHLKIDTGMERIGQHYYTSEKFLEAALRAKNCELIGVFSHFVKAEDDGRDFTELQLERFLESISFFEKRSIPMPLRHMANSGAILQYPDAHLDLVRPGLILYGVSPILREKHALAVKPALTLRSEVVYFKVVPADTGVSYEHIEKTSQQTRVVTIPAGYGDGYTRRLSGCGRVIVRGKSYPIIGRVCMDQFMVDLGPDGEAYNSDEVILIGKQGNETITVEELSALAEIDPRDLLLRLSLRAPKVYS